MLKPAPFVFCVIITVISSMLRFHSFIAFSCCFPLCFRMFPLVFLRFPWVFLHFTLSVSLFSYFRFCRIPCFLWSFVEWLLFTHWFTHPFTLVNFQIKSNLFGFVTLLIDCLEKSILSDVAAFFGFDFASSGALKTFSGPFSIWRLENLVHYTKLCSLLGHAPLIL